MELSKAKYFVYLCTSERGIYIGKDITDVMSVDKWSKKLLGFYSIFDTEKGDILFPIEEKYDGSLYVYGCKFMHIVSVLGFYPYAKIYCYDESSYRYISKIALEKDPEREIIKKY